MDLQTFCRQNTLTTDDARAVEIAYLEVLKASDIPDRQGTGAAPPDALSQAGK
jgi:hypothetical protein